MFINQHFLPMKNQNVSIYTKMQRLTNVTKNLIISGKLQRAKKCLKIAEFLFKYGNTEIKNAISNVFVFSITSFLEIKHLEVGKILPQNLLKEYQQQINSSGI